VTLAVVAGSVLFVYLHLQPGLLWANTTPAGGDMGAHVWGPAYLRDELLPHWRLSGWTPDWYAGFPAYQFYMVVPSLMIVLLDVFLPYGIAFKLISVSGLLALPVAAWALGRLARLPFPGPAALALATVPFVFDRSFTIYGGNAASTLAGEFAFTISLVFALLFLGFVLRGLETGRDRAWAAALLALCVTCHLIPAIFAVVAAGMIWLVSLDWRGAGEGTLRRAWWVASTFVVGGLLSSFWTVPFLLRRAYLNDMGWEKLSTYLEALFPGRIGNWFTALAGGAHTAEIGPGDAGDLTWVIVLAFVGAVASIAFRRRFGTMLTLVAFALAIGVVIAPQGRLWNARLLPFWYLCLYFLAALAVVEIIWIVGALVSRSLEHPDPLVLAVGPIAAMVLVLGIVAFPLRALPFGSVRSDGRYSGFGIQSADNSFIPSWAKWNFTGYERKAAFPEYDALVHTMGHLGATNGCGRAMWEYAPELDRFGTPMALMLLPYWTDGCVGSMEGLYFEASATTPYHFLNQSELSAAPSRAQRDLQYGSLDLGLGVAHLQMLGVRYYMAFSPTAVQQADQDADLTFVASSGAWRIYEVAASELVAPLTAEPAVVKGASAGGKTWLGITEAWYLDPARWGVPLAADGPADWQRIDPGTAPEARPLPAVTVGRIRSDSDSISFDVDQIGVPVVVRASYFPNWEVDGAKGPYRVSPNLMVVVPTSRHVSLHYGRTAVDWLGILLSLVGAVGVVFLARRRVDIPPRHEPVVAEYVPDGDEPAEEPALDLTGV
jgi:uncharacterized membrane protein